MALRMEPGIPPAYVLLRELMEEVRDLLFEQSSGQCETRLLFREPGLEEVTEDFMRSPPLLPTAPLKAGRVEESNPALSHSTGLGKRPRQQQSP